MSTPASSPEAPKQLGLWDAVSIIVGIIVGTGIYETPAGIFRMMPDATTTYLLWAGCGILAFIGALCYAELATTYPRSGGDYVYLSRAYGPFIGYLFGWAQLAVIQTASIGLMAFVFGDYAVRLFDLHQETNTKLYSVLFAAAAVAAMTGLNLAGVRFGKWTQNTLTVVKVLGLTGIVVAGFAFSRAPNFVSGTLKAKDGDTVVVTAPDGTNKTLKVTSQTRYQWNFNGEKEVGEGEAKKKVAVDLGRFDLGSAVVAFHSAEDAGTASLIRNPSALPSQGFTGVVMFAMVLILLTYGGWNDAAFVAAEVRNPGKNIPRALMLGTLGVMVIYLLVNAAYIQGLGFEDAQNSREVAADVLGLMPWQYGDKAMCILVMISALGAVNGLVFTSSRIYSTLGADYSLFAPLAMKREGEGSPIASLILQFVICLLMILSVGTETGQEFLNLALEKLGQQRVDWAGQGGFYLLLRCTAPIFWLFFLMTALALFQLRLRDRDVPRPFAVPLFPVTPLIFCATCAYMLWSGVNYAGSLGFVGTVLVLAGLPFYAFSRYTGQDSTRIVRDQASLATERLHATAIRE